MAEEMEVTTPETPAVEAPAPSAPETPATPSVTADSFYSGQVPKELEAPYKELQASYTRKMQELAMKERAMRESQTAPTQTPPTQVANDGSEPDPYAHQLAQLESRQREINIQLLDQRIDQFASTHPDVYEFANDMADMLLQVPNLSMEKAYWAVKGPKAETLGRQKTMDLLQQKVGQPNGNPVGQANKPTPPKTFNSIADAAADAYNSLAAQSGA